MALEEVAGLPKPSLTQTQTVVKNPVLAKRRGRTQKTLRRKVSLLGAMMKMYLKGNLSRKRLQPRSPKPTSREGRTPALMSLMETLLLTGQLAAALPSLVRMINPNPTT